MSNIDSQIINQISQEMDELAEVLNFLETNCANSLFFETVSANQVSKEVTNLKPDSAPGYDGISVRHTDSKIYCANSGVINKIVSTGTYPEVFKINSHTSFQSLQSEYKIIYKLV